MKAAKSAAVAIPPAVSWRPTAILIAVFAVLCSVLRPWSIDFPLNDDWAYRLPALRLAEQHRLHLTDWASGTQVFHIAWGALWLKLFGLHLGALTCANLAVLAGSSAFFLRFLQEEGIPDSVALLGALTLMFNPIALTLACSFMTDGTYLGLTIVALYYYAKFLREDRKAWLWLGSSAAAAAYLTRQLGVVLPAAVTIELLRRRRFNPGRAAAAWLPPMLAAAGYWAWFRFLHGPTWASENYVARATLAHLANVELFVDHAALRVTATLELLGLSALPLAAGLWLGNTRLASGRSNPIRLGGQASAVVFILAACFLAAQRGAGPYLENTLQRAGLGTLTLGPSASKAAGIWAWPWFWVVLCAASVAGGALLSASLPGTSGPTSNKSGAKPLLLWTGLGHLALSCLGAKYFDRYAAPLLPSALGLLALRSATWDFRKAAGFALLAPLAALSLTGAVDYGQWNRAKWRAGREAVQAGLSAPEIAGGLDWDAWWSYEREMDRLKNLKPLSMIGEWEWQSALTRRAFFSFAPTLPPGLGKISETEYWTPLDFRRHPLNVYGIPLSAGPRGDATGGSASHP